jgi:DNA-binding NarL/FixJ family response regulator
MSGSRRIEVVIADGDEFTRAGLRTVLDAEADVRVVAEAASVTDAIGRCARLDPDVVVLAASLPEGGRVVEACRALRTHARRTRVLVLIDRVDISSVRATVLAGADGCLARSSRVDDVRHVVRTVATGVPALDPSVTRILLDHLRQHPAPADHDGVPLSSAECRALQLVADGKTNREIAAALAVSEKTVKTGSATLSASCTSAAAPRPPFASRCRGRRSSGPWRRPAAAAGSPKSDRSSVRPRRLR